LIGLPPAPEHVDAFLADASPNAYEKLVDRLMAMPQYGERMALPWLDVVRFADTIGYHSDNPRNVWPYRDYVIQAFNENKPFDQFTVEQLAGDLLLPSLPNGLDLGRRTVVLLLQLGDSQAKAFEFLLLLVVQYDHAGLAAADDRLLQIGKEGAQRVEISQRGRIELVIVTLAAAQRLAEPHRADGADAIGQHAGFIVLGLCPAFLGRQQQTIEARGHLLLLRAVRQQIAAELAGELWSGLKPDRAESDNGVKLTVDGDGVISTDRNPNGGVDTYRLVVKTKLAGITGFRLDAMEHASLPSQGPGRAGNGNFVLNEVTVTADGQSVAVARVSATFEQPGFSAAAVLDGNTERLNGWAVMGGDGRTASDRFRAG